MRIRTVMLRSFRNYDRLTLDLPPGLSLLVGDNAQGKTNFLEAVYLCCMGRSHRTPRERELVLHDALTAHARLLVDTRLGAQTTETQIPARGRRRLLVDDRPLRGVADLIGRFPCVFFSPEDLRLVKDGPAERRRFLDRELSQMRPPYLRALMQYTHALKQRNALLKDTRGRRDASLSAWMNDFESVMADRAVAVLRERRAFLERLSPIAETVHRALTGGKEGLSLSYAGADAKDVDEYLWHLRRVEGSDLSRGTSTYGPHRDDLMLRIGGLDIRAYGSQGQQRTAALALKLAEIDLMRELLDESPILLLDDVLSELDEGRQRELLRRAMGVQTLVTSTGADNTLRDVAAARFSVREGRIHRCESDANDDAPPSASSSLSCSR